MLSKTGSYAEDEETGESMQLRGRRNVHAEAVGEATFPGAGFRLMNGPIRPTAVLSRTLSQNGGAARDERLAPLSEGKDEEDEFEEAAEGTEKQVEITVEEDPENFEESEEQARTPKTRSTKGTDLSRKRSS